MIDRAVSVLLIMGLMAFSFMQADTWLQARQTNEFIRQLRDSVTSPIEGNGEVTP